MRAICCSPLFLLALAVCRADTVPERAFRLAVLPDSDCYFRCENSALTGTTAAGLLDLFQQSPDADLQDDSPRGTMLAFLAAVNRQLPFHDLQAVKRSQGSFTMAGLHPAARGNSRFLYAWELYRPLDPQEVQRIILAEAENCTLRVQVQPGKRPDTLQISFPDQPELPVHSMAFLSGHTVILLGTAELLETVLGNIEQSLPGTGLPAALQAAQAKVPAGSSFYALFVPNAAMKAAALARAAQTPQASLLNDLDNLVLILNGAAQTEFTLGLKFANAQSATLGKTMLIDGVFLGMLKMQLLQLSEKPIPMLATMKSDLQGTDAIFTCTVHPDDLATIGTLNKNLRQRFRALLNQN
ncbi:MAG: hypothetical protein GX564_05380 [Oligosphaeraceae bacterium]|nr:hypothetical protein [Oligosphaeraceae bacterium]